MASAAADERTSIVQSGVVEAKTYSPGSFSLLSWGMIGPGLLCCLADTDFGCLVVAAESGARWGYSLLLLQVILVPVLFMAQELTIRLGVYTQQGHTACIRKYFGKKWAWFATGLLWVECVGAMVSEMSGVAEVANLWGAPWWLGITTAVVVISSTVVFCSYRQIEIVGVGLGLFELTFVVTMFMYHPSPSDVWAGMFKFHSSGDFFLLVSSNIGAVIMPWMIYFQQSAIVARRIRPDVSQHEETASTFLGCCLTQLVMIGALVTLAAANAKADSLESVQDIIDAISPQLGVTCSKVLVSLAFFGGSLCAAFVVALAASWALCEATGVDQNDVASSLDLHPSESPYFYSAFASVMLFGVGVLATGVDVVRLNIFIELMDGIFLPFAVGFLFFLAASEALPPEVRLMGWTKSIYACVFLCCVCLSIGSAGYAAYRHL